MIQTTEQMIAMLESGERFSWSRWADGEFFAILGYAGGNCDHHRYFSDMGIRLKSILESKPSYHLALQPLAMSILGPEGEDDPEFNRLVAMQGPVWGNSDMLHNFSIEGRFGEFFEALRRVTETREIVVVGNPKLAALPFDMTIVEIPEQDAWLQYSRIKNELIGILGPGDLVLYSASMMSEVLIDDFKDFGVTQIDTGSVFDPYVGRQTRQYHKTLKIK